MSNRRMRERRRLDPARRVVGLLAALAAVVGAGQAGAQTEDDTSSSSRLRSPPNVLIQLLGIGLHGRDRLASALRSVGDLRLQPSSPPRRPTCWAARRTSRSAAAPGASITTRRRPAAPATGAYLNWYFSSANTVRGADRRLEQWRARVSGRVADLREYQINRLSAAKRVVLDARCAGAPRRRPPLRPGGLSRAAGCLGRRPEWRLRRGRHQRQHPAHANDLEASVLNTKADTWTPLSESLFQGYTYFMSRNAADLPAGATSGTFPVYSATGSRRRAAAAPAPRRPRRSRPSPIDYTCQKNFVIVITDGFPTMDDFDSDPASTAYGFSNFGNLIGDYNADGEVETPGGGNEPSLYLDDIAKFMHENDCRPDMDGDQTLDVYTIGFTTDATANALLQKTAQQGNGLFFTSNNAEELRARLVAAINDIIEKAQSFPAATVPSTRTTSGGSFYSSYFLPSGKSAFWEGHLRAFRIDSVGDVYGQSNVCAYLDPDPGECNSGPQNPAVVPFWDAGEQIPATASRKLLTTKLVSGTPTRVAFDTSLVAADLGLQAFAAAPAPAPNPVYPGTFALNAEGLADEVVQFVRGCTFGTGTSGANVQATRACVDRPWRLGDVFHSGPAVVGAPRAPYSDASYEAFKTAWANRLRVIYAGSNDGFLHAFNAGALDTLVTPPQYQAGTGVELFGFMPWEVRRNIKNLAIDDPTARTYYVDGSPQVVDVWMRNSATDTSKSSTEWKTVLVGGLRRGGRAYYALDVTDPSAAGYPGYLWEFPNGVRPRRRVDRDLDPALSGAELVAAHHHAGEGQDRLRRQLGRRLRAMGRHRRGWLRPDERSERCGLRPDRDRRSRDPDDRHRERPAPGDEAL
ncbi:MAG: PilC/PilY family type IV pilus protein [Myxococcota bacterium]